MAYDLVIRNGTVVDGSGRPRYRADVGVCGGRIATIGKIRERGAEELDAEGHFVAPGFVDGHTHLDVQVCWDPLGTCTSWHGVTSVIMGNCGFTVAPCREPEKDLALRSLERAEDIAREAVNAGVDWKWETFPQYLDTIDALPKGINYAGYIGHSALRAYVMGERAFEEEATDDEVAAMRREVEGALRAGAIGFSTSRSINHVTTDDRPVASRLASWGEVQALVGVMGELGVGVFELANDSPPDGPPRQDYFRKLRELTVAIARPTTFVIACSTERPELGPQFIDLLAEGGRVGARMVGQVHAREFISVIGFPTNLPFDKLPTWKAVRGRPLPEQRAALTDPALRARLRDEALHGRFANALGTEVRPPRYDILRVLDRPEGPWRTVAEVAAERGCTPVDALIDLSLEAELERFFAQPFANQDLDWVLRMLRDPHTVIATSDSGAHVSQISDASIPTFLLSHWVRRQEVFTWEEAVRMLTFDPASLWGLRGRGLVEEGWWADLVVLDPERVGPEVPTADTDLPGGAKRLKQRARGMLATVVNGAVVLREGEHTGALPGRLLRGPLAG